MALEDIIIAAIARELLDMLKSRKARARLKRRLRKALANGNKKRIKTREFVK